MIQHVRKEDFFNWMSVAVTGLAHVVVGIPVMTLGRIHGRLYAEMGDAMLPALTRVVMQYSATRLPLLVGAVLSVLSVTVLGYVVSIGKGRSYLPILVAISLMVVLMHVMLVWFGTSLPLFRVTYRMGNY